MHGADGVSLLHPPPRHYVRTVRAPSLFSQGNCDIPAISAGEFQSRGMTLKQAEACTLNTFRVQASACFLAPVLFDRTALKFSWPYLPYRRLPMLRHSPGRPFRSRPERPSSPPQPPLASQHTRREIPFGAKAPLPPFPVYKSLDKEARVTCIVGVRHGTRGACAAATLANISGYILGLIGGGISCVGNV